MGNLCMETLITSEAKRIADRYNKDFLDCSDVMQITGLGRDKVREIFNSKGFPVTVYGKKKTVNVISFVIWQFKNNTKGGMNG